MLEISGASHTPNKGIFWLSEVWWQGFLFPDTLLPIKYNTAQDLSKLRKGRT